MESTGRGSFSSSEGPPSSKRRRTLLDPESELDLIKRERENDKEIIYEQTKEIRDLKRKLEKSVNNFDVDPELEERLTGMEETEAGLRLEVAELQKRIVDEKADHEKLLAEMGSSFANQIDKLENDIIEKDKKIKDFEEKLSSVIAVKSEPVDTQKLLRDKIDELQLSNNESAKKIKDLKAELQTKANLESFLVNLHQTKISEIETTHKNVLDKIMLNKKNEIQKLVAKHEQEIKASKAKLESDLAKTKSEMESLKLKVENLSKKISEEQKAAIKFQNEITELKGKITVAEENEQKLQAEIDKLKQKKPRETRAVPNDQHEQENYSPVFFALDNVRGGSKINCNRFLGNKNVVVKVAKLVLVSDKYCWLYSTLDPNEKPVKLDLDSPSSCKFQINGELKIESKFVDRLIPRVHSFELTKLDHGDIYVEYDHFKKFVSSGTVKTFIGGKIGRHRFLIGVHEIMKEIIDVEICDIRYFGLSGDSVELAELDVFQNLKKFTVTPAGRSDSIENFFGFIQKNPHAEFIFRSNFLTQTARNFIRENEEEFRERFPSTCKVVIEY